MRPALTELRLRRAARPLTERWRQLPVQPRGAARLGISFRPLIRAVRVVASGEAILSPAVTRRLIAEFALRTRSPRRLPRLDELRLRQQQPGARSDQVSGER